jgi:hypothetical protein
VVKTEKKPRKKKAAREDKSGIRRKAEFRIYPSKAQEATLLEWLELHRNLYNDALAERRDAWKDEKRGAATAGKADLPSGHDLLAETSS